jgi:hypothetical protein
MVFEIEPVASCSDTELHSQFAYLFIYLFILVVLDFELRASSMLGKFSTTGAMLPTHNCIIKRIEC